MKHSLNRRQSCLDLVKVDGLHNQLVDDDGEGDYEGDPPVDIICHIMTPKMTLKVTVKIVSTYMP